MWLLNMNVWQWLSFICLINVTILFILSMCYSINKVIKYIYVKIYNFIVKKQYIKWDYHTVVLYDRDNKITAIYNLNDIEIEETPNPDGGMHLNIKRKKLNDN